MIASDDEGVVGGAAAPPKASPSVRQLALDDLARCLRKGLSDFVRAPLYGLFFGGVYAGGGWLMIAIVFRLDVLYLAYPLAIGFALISPFACAGTYEVSRELELGRVRSLGPACWAPSGRSPASSSAGFRWSACSR
jgi:uncharacterized membrane protein